LNLTLGDAIPASPNLSIQHDDLKANLRSRAIFDSHGFELLWRFWKEFF